MSASTDALGVIERGRARRRAAQAELLTASEVAALMNIGIRSVWRLRRAGDLPHVRIGSCTRFARAEVDRYIRNNTRRGSEGEAA